MNTIIEKSYFKFNFWQFMPYIVYVMLHIIIITNLLSVAMKCSHTQDADSSVVLQQYCMYT